MKLTKGGEVRFTLLRNGEGNIIDDNIYIALRIRGI